MIRILLFALLFSIAPALAHAQVPADQGTGGLSEQMQEAWERSGIESAVGTIATAATPELRQALDQLALTIGALAERMANDPELRMSAVRAAEGVVDVARVTLEEQSDVLQEALRRLADRIATMPPPEISVPAPR
jgi:ABC-type transporter Mla subunit MlaD